MIDPTLSPAPAPEQDAAPAPEAKTAGPVATFVAGKARSEVVMLEWPLEFDGKLYDRVTVTRPTTAELEAWRNYINAKRAAGEDTTGERLPMFDVPKAVLDGLDPDDDDRVAEVAERFLPRRYRDDPMESEPTPTTGSSTPSM